jgi:multidrug efflux pump subunit AcrA (membrane-fusion protein)
MTMKRLAIVLGVVVVAAAGYWGYSTYLAPEAQPAAEPVVAVTSGPEMIWASGTLLPSRWASLGLEAGGRLSQLTVEEGQQVAAGDLLASIDVPDLEHGVALAAASLSLAQAQLEQVAAPARTGEIAAAEAQVQAAQANLEAAQAALSTAQATLQELESAPSSVEAAQAALAAAQAEVARLQAGPRQEAVAVAEAQVQQAATELAFAQSQVDRFGAGGGNELRYQRDAAAAAHNTALAQLNLAQAQASPQDIAVAQAAVDGARAQLAQAEANDRALQARVQSGRAGVQSAEAQVAGAQAAVAQAQAQLQLLREGATPEAIAIAQAQVRQAEATLAQAEGSLGKARLEAPFDGTVGQILVREGELLLPAQPVIVLGDLSHLRVETTDLRETDVAKVSVGQEVEITFDAIPGEVWLGTIARIAPMSSVEQGSTNYTAIVELEEIHPSLRWGMTAFVNIEAAH